MIFLCYNFIGDIMNYNLRSCTIEDYEFLFKIKIECMKWYIEKIYGWDETDQREFLKKEMNEKMQYMNIIQFRIE